MVKRICGIFVLAASVALSACGGASAGSSSASSAVEVTPAAESIPATSVPVETPEPTPAIEADAVEPVTLENYGEKMEEIFSSEKQSESDALDEVLKTVGEGYDSYLQNKDSLTSWFTQVLEESSGSYDEGIALTKEVYRVVAEKASQDDDFDWDDSMDDIKDTFEDVLDSFSSEKKIMYDRINAYEKSIFDPGNSDADEDVLEEAADAAGEELSDAAEKDNDLYEEALKELKRNHEAVEDGFDEGNFDVDALLQKAADSSDDDSDDADEERDDDADEEDDDSDSDSDKDKDDDEDDEDNDKDSEKHSDSSDSDSEKSNSDKQSSSGDEVDPDFKSDMDSYKEFFDDYKDFKKHQKESGNTDDPGDYEEKKEAYKKELDNIKKDELSDADRKYYEDTMDSIDSDD